MKIVVMSPTYLPVVGGAELGIFQIYRRLAARHEVVIKTPRLPGRVNYREGEDLYFHDSRLRIERYEDLTSYNGIPLRLRPFVRRVALEYSRSAQDAARLIPADTDVVNCHYVVRNLGAIRILVRRGIPIVTSVVGREFDLVSRNYPSWHAVGKALKKSNAVVYISEYLRSSINIIGRCDRVIPYGVDTARYRPGPRNPDLLAQHGIAPDADVIFSVQRLARVKRLDILLEAFAIVASKKKNAVLLIGGTGDDEERLRMRSKELGLNASVRWCGYIPENSLPEYYRVATVVAFHSMNETFGVVIPQAMASGVPLVTTRCTALQEVVQDGETGLLCEPGNPAALAQSILILLSNKELARDLADRALQEARSRYSWDRIAGEYEEVLANAAGEKTRTS
jgi:glycosyltransferase involved in cell wall biosynthesis